MKELIYGLGLFFIAFLLHAAIWRIKKPANTIKALILLFMLVLAAGSIFLPVKELPEFLYIWLIFLSLFSAYLLAYPAIEVDSPSLVIVMRIFQSGKGGLSFEKLEEFSGDNLLVEPRLKDLVDAGLVDLSSSVYKINKQGAMFVLPFIFYRNILGLGKGG